MNLSIRQLQTFRDVMRTGSVSEAARVLGRTQPAVSAMLAKLEDEIGFKLFDRTGGRLIPRPEAHYFLEEAESILTRLAQSQRVMREISSVQRGSLRIACFPAAADVFMPRIIANFVQDKPDVSASVMMHSSVDIWERIASQQFDLGLAEICPPRPTITQIPFDLHTICALPKGHRLASAPHVTPSLLDGEAAAALYGDHPVATGIRTRFHEAGARFNQRFEVQTFMSALELVRQNLCFCICDPITAYSHQLRWPDTQGVVFRPFLPHVPCPAAIFTPAHRPASRIAQAFADRLAVELRGLMPKLEQAG